MVKLIQGGTMALLLGGSSSRSVFGSLDASFSAPAPMPSSSEDEQVVHGILQCSLTTKESAACRRRKNAKALREGIEASRAKALANEQARVARALTERGL